MLSRIQAILIKLLSVTVAEMSAGLYVMYIFLILTTFSFASSKRTQTESLAKKKARAVIGNMSKEEIRNYYHEYHNRIPQKLPKAKYSKIRSRPSTDQNRLKRHARSRSIPENMTFPGEFEEVQAIIIAWPYMFFDSTGEKEAIQIFKNIGVIPGKFPDSVEQYLDNLPDSILNNEEKMTRILDSLDKIYNSVIQSPFPDSVEQYLGNLPDSILNNEEKMTRILDSLDRIYMPEGGPMEKGPIQRVISLPDVSTESEMAILFAELAKAIDDNVEVWIRIMNSADSIEIKSYLAQKKITLSRAKFLVYPGNDYWTRDYGPVAFYYGPQDSIGFIDFEYYNGRPLDDSLPIYIGQNSGYPVFTTSLEFEGGNILLDGCGNLFTTDIIDSINGDTLGQDIFGGIIQGEYIIHNKIKKKLSAKQVRDSLKLFLNLDKYLILPALKHDGGTGHIDVYADLWDENTFIFSQMPSEMSSLTDYSILKRNISEIMGFRKSDSSSYRIKNIPLPRKDDGSWYTDNDDFETNSRTYSNHLFVNKTIIQPVYANRDSGDYINLQNDLDSLKSQYPGYKIVPIYAGTMTGMGGSIHCLTKQIPADNPLRIIHFPVEINNEYKTLYPVSAKVHNRSGIAKTVCKWRYRGAATWNSIQLAAANSNYFSGAIENDRITGIIEYYLEATSNNGKTMTKPITAPGGFYTFKFGNVGFADLNTKNNNDKRIEIIQKPSLKKVYIKTAQLKTDFNVQLINLAGKAVYSRNFTDKSADGLIEINTNSINAGIFITVIQSKYGYVLKEKILIKIASF